MTRRALFITEGTSDLPLARHLEYLCHEAKARVEVVEFPGSQLGEATVGGRLRRVLAEDPDFDLVMIHRDSDGRDPRPRYEEIEAARVAVAFAGPAVGVVPVRMTEAWLLLDDTAIREVAGKPHGTAPLGLPPFGGIERLADPKTALMNCLVAASELHGRRLKIFRKQFNNHRRLLIERLDPNGQVRALDSWKRLSLDLQQALAALPSYFDLK